VQAWVGWAGHAMPGLGPLFASPGRGSPPRGPIRWLLFSFLVVPTGRARQSRRPESASSPLALPTWWEAYAAAEDLRGGANGVCPPSPTHWPQRRPAIHRFVSALPCFPATVRRNRQLHGDALFRCPASNPSARDRGGGCTASSCSSCIVPAPS
jgi:hypothetical protein